MGEVIVIDGVYKYNGKGTYYYSKNIECKCIFDRNQLIKGTISNTQTNTVLSTGTYCELYVSDLKNTVDVRTYLLQGTVYCNFKCGLGNERNLCCYTGSFLNKTFCEGTVQIVDSYKLYEGTFDTTVQVFTTIDTNIACPPYSGQGIEYYDANHVKYDGQWKNGKYHGDGSFINADTFTMEYSGGYLNGIRQGAGTLFDSDGNVIWAGNFRDGDIA